MYKLNVRIDLVKQINIEAGLKEMYLLLLEISVFFFAEVDIPDRFPEQ